MKYDYRVFEEAGTYLIIDEYMENCKKFPDKVATYKKHLICSNAYALNALVHLAIINALCKQQESEK